MAQSDESSPSNCVFFVGSRTKVVLCMFCGPNGNRDYSVWDCAGEAFAEFKYNALLSGGYEHEVDGCEFSAGP